MYCHVLHHKYKRALSSVSRQGFVFSLVERVGVCTLSVSYSKAIKYHQTGTTPKSLDELKYCKKTFREEYGFDD